MGSELNPCSLMLIDTPRSWRMGLPYSGTKDLMIHYTIKDLMIGTCSYLGPILAHLGNGGGKQLIYWWLPKSRNRVDPFLFKDLVIGTCSCLGPILSHLESSGDSSWFISGCPNQEIGWIHSYSRTLWKELVPIWVQFRLTWKTVDYRLAPLMLASDVFSGCPNQEIGWIHSNSRTSW
jgi:hypothetical protein